MKIDLGAVFIAAAVIGLGFTVSPWFFVALFIWGLLG